MTQFCTKHERSHSLETGCPECKEDDIEHPELISANDVELSIQGDYPDVDVEEFQVDKLEDADEETDYIVPDRISHREYEGSFSIDVEDVDDSLLMYLLGITLTTPNPEGTWFAEQYEGAEGECQEGDTNVENTIELDHETVELLIEGASHLYDAAFPDADHRREIQGAAEVARKKVEGECHCSDTNVKRTGLSTPDGHKG